eukprot:7815492-Pyramimonas_sp.AAC.1
MLEPFCPSSLPPILPIPTFLQTLTPHSRPLGGLDAIPPGRVVVEASFGAVRSDKEFNIVPK